MVDQQISNRERREHRVFLALMKSVPGLEERLMNAESEDDIHNLAALVRGHRSLVLA